MVLSWLERTPDKREVDGSSPFRVPYIESQLGSCLAGHFDPLGSKAINSKCMFFEN